MDADVSRGHFPCRKPQRVPPFRNLGDERKTELMRILYGVTGEGLGHAMRAQVLLAHLASQGHRVLVAASGRAACLLAVDNEVVTIDGLSIRYANGAVQRARTLAENARGALRSLYRNACVALEEVASFAPEIVVTDFDSFSYIVGRMIGCPIISFDHQHVLSHCRHPATVRRRLSYDFRLAERIVRQKMRGCDRYIVTSFYAPEIRSSHAANTTLVGPVVRSRLKEVTPTVGEHVLVYQTAAADSRLEESLQGMPGVPFRVYGLGARPARGNIDYRAFDEEGFIRDLAEARAVITNGGYTTLSEALFMGKPVLSVPMRHQGEQELNAAYLEHLGLGVRASRPSIAAIRLLLKRADCGNSVRNRIACGTAHAKSAMDAALLELS